MCQPKNVRIALNNSFISARSRFGHSSHPQCLLSNLLLGVTNNEFFSFYFQISVRNPTTGADAEDLLPSDDPTTLEVEFAEVNPKNAGTGNEIGF